MVEFDNVSEGTSFWIVQKLVFKVDILHQGKRLNSVHLDVIAKARRSTMWKWLAIPWKGPTITVNGELYFPIYPRQMDKLEMEISPRNTNYPSEELEIRVLGIERVEADLIYISLDLNWLNLGNLMIFSNDDRKEGKITIINN